ncbi:hypothetical protein HHK36_013221 [Tetracentron sinense]|uniref:Omega-hydroxypalmitate O-feruloyl transferase n=1 Tax=Tetracentron sinense TaxID=13715 RepID=A0A834Z7C5_TETSI|nr:hypothetical protein HHK36_013221 [Tetracentron sinense]
MGTLYQGTPSLVDDLKVTLQRLSLLHPLEETEKRTMFLSNIDQVLNFNVDTVHFFAANPDFPPETIVDKLETALRRVLVPYDFLAGRLRFNPHQGRLEIDCNCAGAGFAVATSELSLADMGDLVYPNPAFQQLILGKMESLEKEDQPLYILQVTLFKCGGFAMGISNSHTTFDGTSFKIFLENLASLAADKPLAVTPYKNRHLLTARSPPRVTFPHPEMVKLEIQPGAESNTTVFEATQENLDIEIFRLSSDDIAKLKEKAKSGRGNNVGTRITGFNIVTALIWRCKGLAGYEGDNEEKTSTILYAVDLRSRLRPPLPPSYTGNAVLTAYATASCRDLEEGSFSDMVEMVSRGAARMTNEYARSVIDWGELHKGFPHGDVLVSSWWRLGFDEVEYPWGRPRYSCPVVYHRKDIILLFPEIEGVSDKGVNILVALPSKEMKKFHALFYNFLG